jgi:hypothetical protein
MFHALIAFERAESNLGLSAKHISERALADRVNSHLILDLTPA